MSAVIGHSDGAALAKAPGQRASSTSTPRSNVSLDDSTADNPLHRMLDEASAMCSAVTAQLAKARIASDVAATATERRSAEALANAQRKAQALEEKLEECAQDRDKWRIEVGKVQADLEAMSNIVDKLTAEIEDLRRELPEPGLNSGFDWVWKNLSAELSGVVLLAFALGRSTKSLRRSYDDLRIPGDIPPTRNQLELIRYYRAHGNVTKETLLEQVRDVIKPAVKSAGHPNLLTNVNGNSALAVLIAAKFLVLKKTTLDLPELRREALQEPAT